VIQRMRGTRCMIQGIRPIEGTQQLRYIEALEIEKYWSGMSIASRRRDRRYISNRMWRLHNDRHNPSHDTMGQPLTQCPDAIRIQRITSSSRRSQKSTAKTLESRQLK
jgi:hypothetical protein